MLDLSSDRPSQSHWISHAIKPGNQNHFYALNSQLKEFLDTCFLHYPGVFWHVLQTRPSESARLGLMVFIESQSKAEALQNGYMMKKKKEAKH